MSSSLTISKSKGDEESGVISKDDWFQCIIESKVATSVDYDTNTRNDKSSVQTNKAIRFDCLGVDIIHASKLALATLKIRHFNMKLHIIQNQSFVTHLPFFPALASLASLVLQ